MDLDDGQVRVAGREIFGRDLELGHGVRALIADELKRRGYTILEWKALDQVLTAQGLPPDKRSDPVESKRLNRTVAGILDGVVLGSLLQLGRDTKSGVKAIGPSGESAPFYSTQEQMAAIELRLMNARTGEVVFACEGSGVARGAGQSVFRPKGGGRITGIGVDFTSPEFGKSMVGEAITKAVGQAVGCLVEAEWTVGGDTAAPGPASELLATMLVKEIEIRRNKGFDEDRAILPSSADLRVGRTVFVQPMTYNFHLDVADALRRSKNPLFEVVDDPRTAELWIRGTAGYSGFLKIFGAELTIVPRRQRECAVVGEGQVRRIRPQQGNGSGRAGEKDRARNTKEHGTAREMKSDVPGGRVMCFARLGSWVAGATVLVGILFAAEGQESRKKRLAVLDFEYGTVRSEVNQMFGSDVDIGRGMAALLVKHLVKDGTYTVVEPRLVQMSLSQQGPSGEWRTDLAEAARVGGMLGVDAIVVGTIVQFGAPRKKVVGGGAAATGGGGGGGIAGKESRRAVVAVTARVVDIENGEVVAVADATGESMRSSKSFAGFGMGAGGFGFGGIDLTTSGFLGTIIGEATAVSISQLSRDLIAANDRVRVRQRAADQPRRER